MRYYTLAADIGNAEAKYRLAVKLANGQGVKTDLSGAIELFREAALARHSRAAMALGVAYASGTGVMRDIQLSADYFRIAAELGEAEAFFKLGRLYLTGALGFVDRGKAMAQFKAAAARGLHLRNFNWASSPWQMPKMVIISKLR